ncbi:MAG: hypothetical protein Q4G14_01230 [Paracoccus sp. (in: a-proteobacteria)]|uniref:hypothetical protein n=1 Tax=Paracoccus sp. TaxID=267 RepID=UPI0026DFDD79|nr:hypothetical protein [Paracoccus sp. (in: a-proteobacteria)]MDO5611848.1 hypothetical protein [Paracoccus sp. (in: a-proteobacteria)]
MVKWRAAALRLRVSPATGARWHIGEDHWPCRSSAAGTSARQGRLAPHQAFLEELIAQDPGITLFELRDALADAEGVQVHHASIANLLSRLGFTYQKVAGCR